MPRGKQSNKVEGTALPETLVGTDGPDLIDGLAGDDTLFGYASGVIDPDGGGPDDHDTIMGGDGDDEIHAGGGNDDVQGGDGNDTIFGGSGDDDIHGGDGDDELWGGTGNDEVDGGGGFDTMHLAGLLSEYITPGDSSNISLGRKNRYTVERIDGTERDSVKNVEALAFEDGYTLFLDGRNNTAYAVDNALATDEETALTILAADLLGNDIDYEGDAFAIRSVDTTGLQGSLTTTVVDGVITELHYDPGAAFQSLGDGDTDTTSFFYEIGDGGGGTTMAEVVITVTGVGDPAVLGGETTGDVTEDEDPTTLSTGGALTITDTDAGEDAFVPQAATAGSNGLGTFTLDADGNWTWQADNTRAAIQGLAAGATATDSFDAVSIDGSSITVTVTVTGVNDAPAGTDGTVSVLEDQTLTLAAADFGFTDPVDAPDDALKSVIVATLPGAGALLLDGAAVAAGDEIAVADIDAGLLTFEPAADAAGAAYASFTFRVVDDGGTADGGVDTDPTPNTLTIDVEAVNDAPAGTDGAVAAIEDVAYVFAAADFGLTDPTDTPANALAGVIVGTLPGAGTLALDGVAVTAGQEIAAADIAAGLLTFLADPNENGSAYASFDFQVRDDGGTANGGEDTDPSPSTLTIDVAPVDDPLLLTGESRTATVLESRYDPTGGFLSFQTEVNNPELGSNIGHGFRGLLTLEAQTGTVTLIDALANRNLADALGSKLYYQDDVSDSGGFLKLQLLSYDLATGEKEEVPSSTPGLKGGFREFMEFDGKLYFSAESASTGRELFVIDQVSGTAELVADLFAGSGSSRPEYLTPLGGKLYFTAIGNNATDGDVGRELYVHDPVANTTELVEDLRPGGTEYRILGAFDGKLYLSVNDGTTGGELYVHDPATGGIELVADIATGPNPSNPGGFAVLDSTIYFAATGDGDGTLVGRELFSHNVITGETDLVADLSAGSGWSEPDEIVALGGKIYFAATGAAGREIFVHDPAAGTTEMAADVSAGPSGSGPAHLTPLGGKLYFFAGDADGRDLFVFDPESGSTTRLSEFGTVSDFTGLQLFDGRVYFRANSDELDQFGHPIREALFVHDPATGETSLAADVDANPISDRFGPIHIFTGGGPSTFDLDLRPLVSFGDGRAADGGFRLEPVAVQVLPGVTVEGEPVRLVSDGTTLTGFVDTGTAPDALDDGDKVVLTLRVSDATARLTMHERFDHPGGAPVVFDVGPFITGEDIDGDTLPLGPGVAMFQVEGDAPVAVDDALTGVELGTTFIFSADDLTGNDSFGTDGPGAVSLVLPETTDRGYDIVDMGDGTYQITPLGLFPFADSFHYNIVDATGDYDKARVTFDVGAGTGLKPSVVLSVAATEVEAEFGDQTPVETAAGFVRDGDVILWDGTDTHTKLFSQTSPAPAGVDFDIDAAHVFTDSGTILGEAYSAGDMLVSVRETVQFPDGFGFITAEPQDIILVRAGQSIKLDLSSFEFEFGFPFSDRLDFFGLDAISISPDGNLVMAFGGFDDGAFGVGSELFELMPDGTVDLVFHPADGFGPLGSGQGFDRDQAVGFDLPQFPGFDALHVLGEDQILFSVASIGFIDGLTITPGDIVYLDGADATILVHEEEFFPGGSGNIDALDPPLELVEQWLTEAGFEFDL